MTEYLILAVKAEINLESEVNCMWYKCVECGHIFESGEESVWSEDRGEFWGIPCSESVSGCPVCHGEYEEVTPCRICGKLHFEDELFGDVCENCIGLYKYDVDTCFKLGEDCREDIELNGFILSMFTKGEIEAILYRELKKKPTDCSEFIEADESWFGEHLIKQLKGVKK